MILDNETFSVDKHGEAILVLRLEMALCGSLNVMSWLSFESLFSWEPHDVILVKDGRRVVAGIAERSCNR